ncbi:hypothetical protein ACFLWI_04140 [Chloroflexota bacterium]
MGTLGWASIFVLILLVLIGVWPLLRSRSLRREKKHFDDFNALREWLMRQVLAANSSVDFMSGELPPQIYDRIAEVVGEKENVQFRVLTGKSVLCEKRRNKEENKMVELAFNGRPANLRLQVLNELPKNHIKIFDRQVAWREDEHLGGPEVQSRDGAVIHDPVQVSLLSADFDWLWRSSRAERPKLRR